MSSELIQRGDGHREAEFLRKDGAVIDGLDRIAERLRDLSKASAKDVQDAPAIGANLTLFDALLETLFDALFDALLATLFKTLLEGFLPDDTFEAGDVWHGFVLVELSDSFQEFLVEVVG